MCVCVCVSLCEVMLEREVVKQLSGNGNLKGHCCLSILCITSTKINAIKGPAPKLAPFLVKMCRWLLAQCSLSIPPLFVSLGGSQRVGLNV